MKRPVSAIPSLTVASAPRSRNASASSSAGRSWPAPMSVVMIRIRGGTAASWRVPQSGCVKAALGLAGAGPASLAARAADGAVRAADRCVAVVVERVVGHVVVADVAPHVGVGPVGQGRDLPALVLGVPAHLGGAGARG